MRLARPFCIAAVCTLGLLLSTAAAQAQNTKLLPNDTELILTFNLRQMLKSEVAKSNKFLINLAKGKIEETLDDKGIAKYLKKADFDLFTDLHSITIAAPGGNRNPGTPKNPQETFILLEGKFDADKIEAAITELSKDKDADAKFKLITIANVKVFEVTPEGDKVMYIGVLDQKTMVACASKADFAEAIARLNGNKTAKFKSEAMKSLIGTVNSKQSISFVATSNIMAKMAENAPEGEGGDQAKQVMTVLKQMDGFSVAVTIQKDIDFQLAANTKDTDTATLYAGMATKAITGIKAKAAEKAKTNEKLEPAVDIVNTLKVTAQGSNLMIRGQISFDTLEKILQNLPIPKD